MLSEAHIEDLKNIIDNVCLSTKWRWFCRNETNYIIV